jgi:hypothetical protein
LSEFSPSGSSTTPAATGITAWVTDHAVSLSQGKLVPAPAVRTPSSNVVGSVDKVSDRGFCRSFGRSLMQRLLVRLPAAVLLLVGGLVHLDLWWSGYRGIPYIGPLFFVNAVMSALIALALVARSDRRVTLPGMAIASGSLVAFGLSRTVGLFGFMEAAWTPAAFRTIAAEIGTIVAIALIVLVKRRQPELA